jgi:hypothetical protein
MGDAGTLWGWLFVREIVSCSHLDEGSYSRTLPSIMSGPTLSTHTSLAESVSNLSGIAKQLAQTKYSQPIPTTPITDLQAEIMNHISLMQKDRDNLFSQVSSVVTHVSSSIAMLRRQREVAERRCRKSLHS